jgi:cytochrome P450
MVIAEAMRLYPPTWLFVRVAQHEDVLPSGVFVAAESKIYLSQWVMHRNPRWFPDPDRFDPRRFSSDAVKARPRFSYLPFGAGRRLCIGEEFAWMQGVLILAAVARRFRLAVAPGQTITPEPNVTLRPRGGLRMRLARR